jgi:hypothetical protein
MVTGRISGWRLTKTTALIGGTHESVREKGERLYRFGLG